jgi:hypothetical protein
MRSKVNIYLRGTGVQLKWRDLSKAEWKCANEKAKSLNESLEVAYFDLEFFPLRLGKTIINTHDGFQLKNQVNGLLADSKSFIEINVSSKRKSKFFIQSLIAEPPLFPSYQINQEEFQTPPCAGKSICEVHTSVGLISTFRFQQSEFNLDKLKFTFHSVPHLPFKVLTAVKYGSKTLESKRDDYLITGQHLYV